MTSPLVDPEGFPRADIDVYTVRLARTAIVRLRNDHRAVVEEMGRVLQVVYAVETNTMVPHDTSSNGADNGAPATRNGGVNGRSIPQPALAKVNAVAPGSPAAEAVSFYSAETDDDELRVSDLLRAWRRMILSWSLVLWMETIRSRMLASSSRGQKG
jgi:hypothetical protein